MILPNVSTFASLKEFKLTSFESLLKKKISQANLEWHPGRVAGAGRAPGRVLHELWLGKNFW